MESVSVIRGIVCERGDKYWLCLLYSPAKTHFHPSPAAQIIPSPFHGSSTNGSKRMFSDWKVYDTIDINRKLTLIKCAVRCVLWRSYIVIHRKEMKSKSINEWMTERLYICSKSSMATTKMTKLISLGGWDVGAGSEQRVRRLYTHHTTPY